MHAYRQTFLHACMHACIHTYKHIYMHACMHTYILLYLLNTRIYNTHANTRLGHYAMRCRHILLGIISGANLHFRQRRWVVLQLLHNERCQFMDVVGDDVLAHRSQLPERCESRCSHLGICSPNLGHQGLQDVDNVGPYKCGRGGDKVAKEEQGVVLVLVAAPILELRQVLLQDFAQRR